MNTSQFMDKQIMDLSNSQNNDDNGDGNNDLTDQTNVAPQEEDHHSGGGSGGDRKDEILPNYDFQPIRPVASSQPSIVGFSNVGGTRVWSSAESKTNSAIRNYHSLEPVEPATAVVEKAHDGYDASLLSEIDRTMKKHADNLMHALEGVTARLSQLETKSRHLETSIDDLKASIGNHHGSTDGKLRQVENIIREVQTGIQVVKDKQELLETRLQLSKPQTSKGKPQPESTPLQTASAPQQSHCQLPPAVLTQPPPPPLTTPNPPLAAPPQYPTQFSQSLNYPPPGQTPEAPAQQYQLPPHQAAAPPPPQPQYQPPPHVQFSQQHPPLSPMGHHSEEPSYLQPPSIRQPSGGPPPPQHFYGNPSQVYEPPPSRPGSGFSGQYPPPSGHAEQYPYGGSQSQYGGGSPRKPQQYPSPNAGPGGGTGYPQLPTARILPHALPTASGVGGGSGGGSGGSGSGNRVPIDDVVDKVTNMGFPRDQVRAIVRKLTENGQAVDLNVVLDKVMTDGVENQGPRGWFGR